MILPHHVPSDLVRAIQHEQDCQQRVAMLEHESLVVAVPSGDSVEGREVPDALAQARAEWDEALRERRRLEEQHHLASELERLRARVRAERSTMSRWAKWREARSFRKEVG